MDSEPFDPKLEISNTRAQILMKSTLLPLGLSKQFTLSIIVVNFDIWIVRMN